MRDYTCRHAVDSLGNIYLTGEIRANTPFGVSGGFLAKYGNTGTLLWSNCFAPLSMYARAEGYGAAVDTSGNCFVTGAFYGTVDFGGANLTCAGNGALPDVFIAKFDSGGNLLWVRRAGGYDQDVGISVATDGGGNCYITGGFVSTNADFGGVILTNHNATFGELRLSDIFFVEYDPSGNVVWAKQAGGAGGDFGRGIAVDSIGNLYVGGLFYGPTFDGVAVTNPAGGVLFLARYNFSGDLSWVVQAGDDGFDSPDGLVVDSEGNCYMAGTFRDSATFGGITITNAGGDESHLGRDGAFLAKYDSSGDCKWVKHTGSTDKAMAHVLAIDKFDNCYVLSFPR